jgi:tetratricopeptide (TPR) repeat protein
MLSASSARPERPRGGARAAVAAALLALLPLPACSGNHNPDTSAAQLQFGVDMARRGLWREALFRFRQAERMDPDNPHIYNNLAVAYEANGEFDRALEYYQKALRAAPDNREARGNYARFVEFYQAFKPKEKPGPGAPGAAPTQPAPGASAPAAIPPAPVPPAAPPPAEPEPVDRSPISSPPPEEEPPPPPS